MTLTADSIPGWTAGTWKVDPSHSEVTFSVRHLAISKVKGKFETFDATLTTTGDPLETTVEATAEVASINTGQEPRDQHLKTGDFFLAEEYPQLTFRSTGIREGGKGLLIDGELTLRGVTKNVTFTAEFGGVITDGYGQVKLGAEATTKVDRTEYGLNWNAALEAGGFTLGNEVTISLDVQFVLQAA